MKRLRLFCSTLVIGCLSLGLVSENAQAFLGSNSQGMTKDKIQYLLAEDSESTSQEQIINVINSLTPEQKQQIDSILKASQTELDKKDSELDKVLQSLEDSLTPTTPSSTISQTYKQVLTLLQERNQIYFGRLIKIRDLLNVKQRGDLNQSLDLKNSPFKVDSQENDLLDSLNDIVSLTSKQQQEIDSIKKTFQPEIDKKTSELKAALQSFNQSLKPETPSSTLSKGHNQVLTLAVERNQVLFERLMKIRDVLTVDQRTELNQMIKDLASD